MYQVYFTVLTIFINLFTVPYDRAEPIHTPFRATQIYFFEFCFSFNAIANTSLMKAVTKIINAVSQMVFINIFSLFNLSFGLAKYRALQTLKLQGLPTLSCPLYLLSIACFRLCLVCSKERYEIGVSHIKCGKIAIIKDDKIKP